MSLADSIVEALKTFADVVAIVGSGENARIEPDVPDESTALPCIFYDIDKTEWTALDGAPGAGEATVTITCRAASRNQSEALAKAVRDRLWSYGSASFDCVLQTETHSTTPADDGSPRIYRDVIQEYWCYYKGE